MLLGREYVREFLLRAVKLAKHHGFDAEATYFGEQVSAMRSARRGVHQTPIGREGELVLRMRRGKKAVEVVVSSPAEIGTMVRLGKELIASAKPNPVLYPLVRQPKTLPEETLGLQVVPKQFWDDLSIKRRAFQAINKAADATPGWYGAGYFLCVANETGVANSAGLIRYFTTYYSVFIVVATGGKRKRTMTAYADEYARLPQEINFRGVVEQAFARARLTDELPLVDPLHGRTRVRMDVILSPNFVADWLKAEAMTFSGYRIHTGQSYVSSRVQGKSRIAGRNITLRDDWLNPLCLKLPFDLDGRNRQKVMLVDLGIYAGCTYGGMSAKMAGSKSTGHSGGELDRDLPDSLVLEGQDNSSEDLVRSCVRPTLVLMWSHYNADMYEKEGMWTATGHHGVFLAKGGKLVAVCPPTRIRLRTLDALRRVQKMSASKPIYDVECYPLSPPDSAVVPWMKIRGVEFINL